jgi:glycosyltransferase involved in cell wall biosynthesis
MGNPLVSCIIATGNRQRFLEQAIRCFRRQNYPERELIIVDDSEISAEELVRDGHNIRYLKLDIGTSTGKKLNIGIEAARGSIIQKLDDDDFYHPGFLSSAIAYLKGNDPRRTLVAWDCFLILMAGEQRLRFSGHGWVAGGTFCFYRDLWECKHFRDIGRTVDYWFIKDHQPKVVKVCAPELYVMVRHGLNTWKKLNEVDVDDYFHRLPFYGKLLDSLFGSSDYRFYHSLVYQG